MVGRGKISVSHDPFLARRCRRCLVLQCDRCFRRLFYTGTCISSSGRKRTAHALHVEHVVCEERVKLKLSDELS